MIVDAHCHIDYPQFDEDREEVIIECQKNKIVIINSIVNPENLLGLELARKYENVYCTLGLSASSLDPVEFQTTIKLLKEYKDEIVGLGEVGIDHYWVKEKNEHEIMEEHFKQFIELSKKLKLPLIVHSRDAEEKCLDILEEYDMIALLHCFSGTVEQALKAVEKGHIISIPTSIAYSKPKKELATRLPLESIVLESDAPFLAPTPKTRNNPMNLYKSVNILSLCKGIAVEEAIKKTTRNALEFYGI